MRKLVAGLIMVALLVGSVAAERYVVCVKRYQRSLGEINATDYRGRSIEGTIDQECLACYDQTLIPGTEPGSPCGQIGLWTYTEVYFGSFTEAQMFFRTRCNRCW